MSRSYKKNPIVKSHDCGGKGKQFANRKVRRAVKDYDEIPKGGIYKKFFSSWDINDYILRWTKEDAIEYYNKRKREYENGTSKYYIRKSNEKFFKEYPTLEIYLQKEWERGFKRK